MYFIKIYYKSGSVKILHIESKEKALETKKFKEQKNKVSYVEIYKTVIE